MSEDEQIKIKMTLPLKLGLISAALLGVSYFLALHVNVVDGNFADVWKGIVSIGTGIGGVLAAIMCVIEYFG